MDIFFAGTFFSGIFRSTDNGANWMEVNSGLRLSSFINALVINSNRHIFAGTSFFGVFRSTDNGGSWTQTGLKTTVNVLAITNPNGHIFAGTVGKVFRSTDNGATWTATNIGLTNTSVNTLAINSNGDIFAGTSNFLQPTGRGVFRSTDNGVSWTQTGLTNISIYALAINSNEHIFAGTDSNGVFLSTDNGFSWTQTGLANNSVSALAISSNGHIFAGTDSNGVFLSTDNGVSWTQAGLTNTFVLSIAINSKGHIFAGTFGAGVFRSANNGTKWTQVNTGLTTLKIFDLAINFDGSIFAGTEDGLFRSVQSTLLVPSISSSTRLLNFGAISPGSNSDQKIILTNSGNDTLTIASMAIAGANAGEFAFVSGDGAGTLAPNVSRDITLRFSPTSAGSKTASLIISSNAPSSPDTVALRGSRVAPQLLSLDGVDDYVARTLPGVVKSQTITIAAWVMLNRDTVIKTQTIVAAQGRGDHSDGRGVSLNVSGNREIDFIIGIGEGDHQYLYGFTKMATGTWYYLAATYDGAIRKVYLNGIEDGSSPFSTPIEWDDKPPGNFPDPAQLYFGAQHDNANTRGNTVPNLYFFNGKIDEIRIWNRALTQAEIQASMFTTLAGNEAGLVGYWNFDAGTANDMTNNGNHGALKDGATIIPGAVAVSRVSLSSAALDFGALTIDGNSDLKVMVTNTGGANLNIDSTMIIGPNAGEFAVVSGGGAGTLAPSAFRDLSVRFSPQSSDGKTAFLILNSDAASSPDTVALRGRGAISSVQVNHNTTATAGKSLKITVTTSPNFQPTSSRLYFRQAGRARYDSTTLVQAGNDYNGNIPTQAVALRGVEYYLRLSDGNTVITFPAADPQNKPQTIRVKVDQHKPALGLRRKIYKMISVPLELSPPQLAAVLADDYAAYDTLNWRVFRWDSRREVYVEYDSIRAGFTPGAAFWLINRDGEAFDVDKALSTNSAQPYVVMLQPGWNQVSNPFAFPVAWNRVAASASGRMDKPAYFDGREYQREVATLQPWEGYFIKNLESVPITLSIPPVEADSSLGKSVASIAIDPANEYLLQLAAEISGTNFSDTQNYLGLSQQASEGRDALDFTEPPPIGNYLRLSMREGEELFAGNFKPFAGNGQQWEVEIISTQHDEPIHLIWQETGKLPEGFQLYILDREENRIIPTSDGKLNFELNEILSVKRLKIILGTKEYAASHNEGIPLVPLAYALEQNYPNPFSAVAASKLETMIRYQLSRRGPVVLEIYNVLGQKLRTLVNDVQNTGPHTVSWDGLDEARHAVASGVYIYRLRAGEFAAARKLVLTR